MLFPVSGKQAAHVQLVECFNGYMQDVGVQARLKQVAETCKISASGDFEVGNCFGNDVNMIRAKRKQAYGGIYESVSVPHRAGAFSPC